ncbi:DUF4912 domain-containing protein [Desulfotomaculum copahuensis]|uniref:DUF4912 domain-containing protein n=1 Tax=Desulfotomaculum copahuensis TaxID=1838280 RepID=A0A1B7LEU2_9FIRM|nr:DUF4912 domain-containing protein [Desulfotomaculum copahuensis]OAT81820.1 hypothetical protein A6M21_10540 [Desulfotomaculum copahuensis]
MITENVCLPGAYQENTLVLLVQNPEVIFAYWELSNGQWLAVAGYGGLHLRLYEINGNGPGCWLDGQGKLWTEINLPPFTSDWYFCDLSPGRSYCSELGYYGSDHVFYPILRSNRVQTPRVGLSSRPGEHALVAVDLTVAAAPAQETATGQLPGSIDFYRRQEHN